MIAYTTAGIDEAVKGLLSALERHPEKDLRRTWEALRNHTHPPCAPIFIRRDLAASEDPQPRGRLFIEELLEQNLRMLLRQLDAGNPTAPALEVGFGPPTMATVLGAEFDLSSPSGPDTPIDYLSLDDFDDWEPPPLAEAGLMPRVMEQIEFFKDHTPEDVLISPPDLQSPFNIAHMLIGPSLLERIEDDPDRVQDLMDLITETLIEAWTDIPRWIGMDRLAPTPGLSFCTAATECRCFVSECAATQLSPDRYREFVVPHVQRLERHFGPVAFHPCSHRGVFKEIVRAFPRLRYIEAGWIETDDNDSITLEEALGDIRDDVILDVREHLRPGQERSRLQALLAICRTRPLTYLSVHGSHWTQKDDEAIRRLHAEMDDAYHKDM